MKLGEFRYLADENFDPAVVAHLRQLGWDVTSAVDVGLRGKSDVDMIRAAYGDGRVVLTHDADFGTLAFAAACCRDHLRTSRAYQ